MLSASHFLLLPAVLAVLVVASLLIGSTDWPLLELWQGVLGQDERAGLIFYELRLPRTLLAVVIGATLGLAGAALQGLVRHPLADPALFGAPQSAAAFACALIAFGIASPLSLWVPLAAICGALLSVMMLIVLAGRSAHLSVVLLAGLAISSFSGALVALVLNLAPNPFAALEVAFWLLGSLEDRSFEHVVLSVPLMILSWIVLLSSRSALRILTLGEDAAVSLGVNVVQVRWIICLGVALGVGAATAVCGAIGFVGLVAPHLVRGLVRSDPGKIMLPSAFCGACLLLLADILVRVIPATHEIRLGVVTALVGVPFFVARIVSSRSEPSEVPL